MSEDERTRVGQALDEIRNALAAHVDDAMARAYGQDWNDLVAEEDAKRRANKRKYPVTKNDLAVILKVLIHRRIEPWSSLREYPRVRAFASEVLTLRNLYAHGDECLGEHARLADTGRRLLATLGLPVPPTLQLLNRQPLALPVDTESIPIVQGPATPLERLDAEVADLGETGEQLAVIMGRATALSASLYQEIEDGLRELDLESPDFDAFQRRFREVAESTGAEVLDLLSATDRLAASPSEPTDQRLKMLTFATRCELLSPTLEGVAKLHITALRLQLLDLEAAEVHRIADWSESKPADGELPPYVRDPALEAMERRINEAQRLVAFGQSNDERLRELIRICSEFDDANPLANVFVAIASLGLATASRDEDRWTPEALPYVRDAVARLRFEAGMQPGSFFESTLVRALRFEGEICSDLGQTGDAIKAFARADEIVDRYPAADPAIKG